MCAHVCTQQYMRVYAYYVIACGIIPESHPGLSNSGRALIFGEEMHRDDEDG